MPYLMVFSPFSLFLFSIIIKFFQPFLGIINIIIEHISATIQALFELVIRFILISIQGFILGFFSTIILFLVIFLIIICLDNRRWLPSSSYLKWFQFSLFFRNKEFVLNFMPHVWKNSWYFFSFFILCNFEFYLMNALVNVNIN